MSTTTKEMLGAALGELMESKPLNKITVGEVAAKCGVSRMTFYYHFKDIYDLVKWTFEQYAQEALDQTDSPSWDQGIRSLFDLFIKNKTLVMNVYHSVEHTQLYNTACDILGMQVKGDFDRITDSMFITSEDKQFVSAFFANGVIGVSLNWIERGMREEEVDSIVEHCIAILRSSVMPALKSFEKKTT